MIYVIGYLVIGIIFSGFMGALAMNDGHNFDSGDFVTMILLWVPMLLAGIGSFVAGFFIAMKNNKTGDKNDKKT